MRTEYIEYAFLSEAERDVVSLPDLDATEAELITFWDAVKTLKARRGEQPDEAIYSLPGALRGDTLLSNFDKEIK